MARRPNLIRRAKKKDRSESKASYNRRLEVSRPRLPDDISSSTDSRYMNYLSWFAERYSTSEERREGKQFVIDYMKKAGFSKEEIQLYRTSRLNFSSTTMFAIAWGYIDDQKLPDTSVPWLNEAIKETSKKQPTIIDDDTEAAVVVKDKPDIQERVSEVRSNLIGEIMGMIDDDVESIDLYRHLQGIAAKAMHVKVLVSKLSATRDELREALEGNDPQLKEAYPYRAEVKKLLALYEKMVADCERHMGNAKSQRAPRKKKEKPVNEQVKRVQYLKQWPELKLVSIDPTQIVGAMSLWVYNVKYKTLIHYKSRELAGFKVKGTTLTNYDADGSEQRALRKPEKTLDDVLKGTPAYLKKVMESLTTKPSKPNGRMNENTILLRAVR
jgi:hypothetical protein